MVKLAEHAGRHALPAVVWHELVLDGGPPMNALVYYVINPYTDERTRVP